MRTELKKPYRKLTLTFPWLFLGFSFLIVLGSFALLNAQSSSNVSAEVQTLQNQIDQGLFGLQSYATPIGRQMMQLQQLIQQNGSQTEIMGLQVSIAYGLYSIRTQLQVMRQRVARIRQLAPNYSGNSIDLILQQLDDNHASLAATLDRLSDQNQQQLQRAADQQYAQYAQNRDLDLQRQAETLAQVDPLAQRMTQSVNPLGGLPVQTSQATTVAASSKTTLIFQLWDKNPPSGDEAAKFQQAERIPLSSLSWLISDNWKASATSYAIIVNDPGRTLPSTVLVTLTPASTFQLSVDPITSYGTPFSVLVNTDGTPEIVSSPVGVPLAVSSAVRSGTITISAPGIETLVITVSAQ